MFRFKDIINILFIILLVILLSILNPSKKVFALDLDSKLIENDYIFKKISENNKAPNSFEHNMGFIITSSLITNGKDIMEIKIIKELVDQKEKIFSYEELEEYLYSFSQKNAAKRRVKGRKSLENYPSINIVEEKKDYTLSDIFSIDWIKPKKKIITEIIKEDNHIDKKENLNLEKKVLETHKTGTKVEFRLTILSVHFLYIDSTNRIMRIWGNKKEEDSEYVIKCFDKSDNEIALNEEVLEQYGALLSSINVNQQGEIYNRDDVFLNMFEVIASSQKNLLNGNYITKVLDKT